MIQEYYRINGHIIQKHVEFPYKGQPHERYEIWMPLIKKKNKEPKLTLIATYSTADQVLKHFSKEYIKKLHNITEGGLV